MSILVVGVSHKTAPVSVLERLALDKDALDKLMRDVASSEHVTEATALATCNRIEIYADVERFHGSVESVSRMLCELADEAPEDVVPHLYVHYDDGAVSHLFHVASGLDSMVIGEGQILGQTREALRVGQETGTIGPALNTLFQQALRVGKRVHAETDIDKAAPSLVSVALERATGHVGPVEGRRVLVVGAGSMAGLSVATVSRLGAADVVVASRTHARAERLAQQYGGRSIPLADLESEIASADILVSCTGRGRRRAAAEHGGRGPHQPAGPAGRDRPGAARTTSSPRSATSRASSSSVWPGSPRSCTTASSPPTSPRSATW